MPLNASAGYVPSHRFNINDAGVDVAAKGPSKASYRKARREQTPSVLQMPRKQSRELGKKLQDHFEHAQSWEDVEVAVALEGYKLEAKGQGLVVVGEGTYSKFSALGDRASMRAFEGRFGELFADSRRRPRQLVDGIDIVKALVNMGLADRQEIVRAVDEAVAQRAETSTAHKTLSDHLAKTLRHVFKRLSAPRRDAHDAEPTR